jgi:hypothetical protein
MREAVDDQGHPIIIVSAKRGDLRIAEACYRHPSCDIMARDPSWGGTCGHVAALHGHDAILASWIQAGGDPQACDDDGNSIGMSCAQGPSSSYTRHRQTMAVWITAMASRGTDAPTALGMTNHEGQSIFHLIRDEPMMRWCVDAGGRTDGIDRDGYSVIDTHGAINTRCGPGIYASYLLGGGDIRQGRISKLRDRIKGLHAADPTRGSPDHDILTVAKAWYATILHIPDMAPGRQVLMASASAPYGSRTVSMMLAQPADPVDMAMFLTMMDASF